MKIARLILELVVIAACFYGMNFFVENVTVPDYTQGKQTYEEWKANGSVGGIPALRESDKLKIQQDRNFYRFIFFGLLIVGVGGYFCYKKADKELQKRTYDEINIIASNRKIVFLRTLGLMGIAVFALTMPMCILDENTAVLIVVLYMPLSLAMGPYFIFRKLTNIFSFKFCIAVTISLIIAMIICILLKIPPMLGGTVFGGFPILVLYAKKMSQAAKLLGI